MSDVAQKSSVSVIICTYNPRLDILRKCLESIEIASMVKKPDEVLIIDNNSDIKICDDEEIKQTCERLKARIIIENNQGLTPARLRGIKEAVGDLLVFVDDDNFIDPDFFEHGVRIAAENKFIGSWSGQVKLIFEQQPEAWTRRYWGLLVSKSIDKDIWSNLPHLPETMPCGAGLYVRKSVADYYLELNETGKRNIQLDRSGKSLFSGGDNDLAACACDKGLGVGIFHSLVVHHYIPQFRTEKKYLLKLAEGIAASTVVFRSFRGEFPTKKSIKNKMADQARLLLKKGIERQFYKAVLNGEAKGIELISRQHT